MNEPLYTESEALARARELLAAFDRNPDVLPPDEQALVIAIRSLEPILAVMQEDSDAVDEEAERNSIDTPEHTRRLCVLALTTRHFLRERAKLFESQDRTCAP